MEEAIKGLIRTPWGWVCVQCGEHPTGETRSHWIDPQTHDQEIKRTIPHGPGCPAQLAHWEKSFDVVYLDPPWPMWGDHQKNAAAGKHYNLMTLDQIQAMPIKNLFRNQGALFVWATCPRLDIAMDTIKAWGLHYRGIAFIWVKTRKDGGIIHGQGIPPTATKPTSELCLLATTNKKGRPHTLQSAKVPQVVLHHRGKHSEKPNQIRDHIVQVYGDRPRVELFARQRAPGWTGWGDQYGQEQKEESNRQREKQIQPTTKPQ